MTSCAKFATEPSGLHGVPSIMACVVIVEGSPLEASLSLSPSAAARCARPNGKGGGWALIDPLGVTRA